MTYICAACGAELEFPDVIAVAAPSGAGWYCRDVVACRERREGDRGN